MDDKKYAPIIIPTLNRYKHFKDCVESLSKCSGADKTELYISVDFPPNKSYIEGHEKIIKYLDEGINGFKDVHIYIQKKNLGVGDNLNFLRNIVFSEHDRLIITEDDNIFSPCFLEYINTGLERHKDNKQIFGICGYNYPINIPDSYCSNHNYYYAKEYSAWGIGFFKERFIEASYSMNIDYGRTIIKKHWKKLTWNIRRSVIDSISNNKFYGDLNRTLYLIESDSYCVFPTENMVVNKGHDGSGVNCGNSKKDIYSTQHQSKDIHFEFSGNIELCENEEIRRELNRYFNIPFKSKIKVLLKLFFI